MSWRGKLRRSTAVAPRSHVWGCLVAATITAVIVQADVAGVARGVRPLPGSISSWHLGLAGRRWSSQRRPRNESPSLDKLYISSFSVFHTRALLPGLREARPLRNARLAAVQTEHLCSRPINFQCGYWVHGHVIPAPVQSHREEEAFSAKETIFLTMARASVSSIATVSLAQGAHDLCRHQSGADPQKRVPRVQKVMA